MGGKVIFNACAIVRKEKPMCLLFLNCCRESLLCLRSASVFCLRKAKKKERKEKFKEWKDQMDKIRLRAVKKGSWLNSSIWVQGGYKGLQGKRPQLRRLTVTLFINAHEIMKVKGKFVVILDMGTASKGRVTKLCTQASVFPL
eukprot:1152587-Pelagomonas_calceolata.AAC.2